jgi:hypothetical protein
MILASESELCIHAEEWIDRGSRDQLTHVRLETSTAG